MKVKVDQPFRWPQPRFDFKTDIRRWVMFTFNDSEPWWRALSWLDRPVQKTLCLIWGHAPERDQCNKPEHDFCRWCFKPMPGQWRQGT